MMRHESECEAEACWTSYFQVIDNEGNDILSSVCHETFPLFEIEVNELSWKKKKTKWCLREFE